MPDAYTSTSALGLDQAAYDRAAYHAFVTEMYFDAVASVKPADSNQKGSSTVFRKFGELAVDTTPLSETVDVDAIAMSDTPVTLTLAEYGEAVILTALARYTAYIPLDPEAAYAVGQNAGETMDALAAAPLGAGDNVIYASGGATDPTSRTTINTDDEITAHDIRIAVARLRGAGVPPPPGSGGKYIGFIHPDVSVDLREEAGAQGLTEPANASAADKRWNGVIGDFEGVRWIETPRAPLWEDASDNAGAAGDIDVYGTLVTGWQALAKTWAPAVGPRYRTILHKPTDKLERFPSVGWYWLGAYGRFREESLQRIESASSIGDNAA